MKNLLLTIIFLRVLTAQAQTSDRIKYHIAYDGSGSVAIADKTHKNLQALFQQMTSYKDGKFESTASFDLYVYGEVLIKDKLDINEAVDANQLKSKYADIIKKTSYNRKPKFTHIQLALADIGAQLAKSQDLSAGVFIFTDGLLEKGDISGKDLDAYKQEIDKLISEIKLKIPVFIIVTSDNIHNIDSNYLGIKKDNAQLTNYHNGGDFFWINSNYSVQEDSAAMASFDLFVTAANKTIIQKNAPPKDKISTAIVAQQTINLLDMVQQSEKTYKALENTHTNDNAFGKLLELKKIIDGSKSTMTAEEIVKIKSCIETLQNNPDQLINLRAELSYSIAKVNTTSATKKAEIEATNKNNLLGIINSTTPEQTSMEETKKYEGKNFEEIAILGLTDYIIERAKMEAAYAFMEHMATFLNETENGYILKQVFFPNTYEILNHPERYSDVNRIKTLFKKDIDHLPENIVKHSHLVVRSDALVSLVAFYELYNELMQTASLETAFERVVTTLESTPINIKNSKIKKSITFTATLIGYLKNHDMTYIFERPEETESFARMVIALSLDSSNIKYVDMKKAVATIRATYSKYQQLSLQIKNLNTLLHKDNSNDIEGFRKYQKELLQDILARTATLLLSGGDILEAIEYEDENVKPEDMYSIASLVNSAEKSIEAYLLIKNKEYAQGGILLAGELAKFMTNEAHREKLQILIEVTAEVSAAQTATDVKNIIAKYALPVASYRLKRDNTWNIMLSAYPGAGMYAYHKLQSNMLTPSAGIMCPIGIEFSKGFGKSSVSVMLSILDIGNIVNYRLLGDNEPTDIIKFQNIVSPGGLLTFGPWSRIPLAIVGGYMWNPNRIVAGATIDLPIFSFSKSKK